MKTGTLAAIIITGLSASVLLAHPNGAFTNRMQGLLRSNLAEDVLILQTCEEDGVFRFTSANRGNPNRNNLWWRASCTDPGDVF